jgi:phage shock protein A
LKVRVSDIIDDASRKQKDLELRVSNLKQQITDFEREIATRKDEIERLDADHAETSSVKSRLELAEKAQKAAATQRPASGVIGSKSAQPATGSKA